MDTYKPTKKSRHNKKCIIILNKNRKKKKQKQEVTVLCKKRVTFLYNSVAKFNLHSNEGSDEKHFLLCMLLLQQINPFKEAGSENKPVKDTERKRLIMEVSVLDAAH